MSKNIASKQYASSLDRTDPLRKFRNEFEIANDKTIYLDGNSLGRPLKATLKSLEYALKYEWKVRLIRSWNDKWFDLPNNIGAKIAKVIGARPDEVIIADSTTLNLFKLAFAALQLQKNKHRIVSDNLNFPTDLYAFGAAAKMTSPKHSLRLINSEDGRTVSDVEVKESLNDDVALLALTHASFKSGFLYDISKVTKIAHEYGALMLWDLCHSVGVVPINLNKDNVDFAVGCTYKYLNGGPGSPAFLYVRKDLQEKIHNPLHGWFGRKDQFDLDLKYIPAPGISRFFVGTPPILSMVGIETGVDLILKVGIERIRKKSIQQTQYFVELYKKLLEPLGVTLNSPADPKIRGSHVSLGHTNAFQIDQALIHEMNVIPDFRRPDTIRFGIAPLYTRYEDIRQAIMRTRKVIITKSYEKYSDKKPIVT